MTSTSELAAPTSTPAPETAMSTKTMPKSFNGIDHIKLACHDILETSKFYTSNFPFHRVLKWNHYTPDHELFAIMIQHESTGLIVELRYHPEQAESQKGWDPITWGVGNRKDLEEWASWLDEKQVRRSQIFTGIKGWVMGCEDPDGKIVRLYVQEEDHAWTDHPDIDQYWLGEIRAQPGT